MDEPSTSKSDFSDLLTPIISYEDYEIIEKSSKLGRLMYRLIFSAWEVPCLEEFQEEFIDEFISNRTSSSEELNNLRFCMSHVLFAFHSRNESLKWPLQSPNYLKKMSKIVAFSNDLKFKNARDKYTNMFDIKPVDRIATTVVTDLFIFLGRSIEHILDAILFMECMTEDYSLLAVKVLRKVLKCVPSVVDCVTFLRVETVFQLYLLLTRTTHDILPETDNSIMDMISRLKIPPRCSKHVNLPMNYKRLKRSAEKLFKLPKEENVNTPTPGPSTSDCQPRKKKFKPNPPSPKKSTDALKPGKARSSSKNDETSLVTELKPPKVPKKNRRGKRKLPKRPRQIENFRLADSPSLDEIYVPGLSPDPACSQLKDDFEFLELTDKSFKFSWTSPLNSFLCEKLGVSPVQKKPKKREDSPEGDDDVSLFLPFKFIDILSRKSLHSDDILSELEEIDDSAKKVEEPQPPKKIQKVELVSQDEYPPSENTTPCDDITLCDDVTPCDGISCDDLFTIDDLPHIEFFPPSLEADINFDAFFLHSPPCSPEEIPIELSPKHDDPPQENNEFSGVTSYDYCQSDWYTQSADALTYMCNQGFDALLMP